MIENVQNEHKQAKGAKLCVNIKNGRVKNSQNILQGTWKTEYEKSNNIWIKYWW